MLLLENSCFQGKETEVSGGDKIACEFFGFFLFFVVVVVVFLSVFFVLFLFRCCCCSFSRSCEFTNGDIFEESMTPFVIKKVYARRY